MTRIFLLVFLISQGAIGNNSVLFSLNDRNYTIQNFPQDFKEFSKKEQRDFISRYLYYKLLLDELKNEQKKYKREIDAVVKKNIEKLNRIGVDNNSSYAFLSNYKITLDTTLKNKFLEKYKLDEIEKRVKDFYEKHKKEYFYPNRLEVSHIVLKDENKAKKLLKEFIDKNISIKEFAKIAQKESLDFSNKYAGGYVGYISKEATGDKFFKEMWDSNISYGIYPKLLKKKNYYHILYILSRDKARQIPLKEDRDNILSYIVRKDKREWVSKTLRELKEKVKVKYY